VIARIKTVVDSDDAIEAAWIYGSVARGEDRPASDIDVAIQVAPDADTAKMINELVEIEISLHVSIAPVFIQEQDVKDGRVDKRWWQDVMRDGRQLKATSHRSAGKPPAQDVVQ
jgi:predicted nucleotidyltransferase